MRYHCHWQLHGYLSTLLRGKHCLSSQAGLRLPIDEVAYVVRRRWWDVAASSDLAEPSPRDFLIVEIKVHVVLQNVSYDLSAIRFPRRVCSGVVGDGQSQWRSLVRDAIDIHIMFHEKFKASQDHLRC